jgi:DNA-binding response OmpR family regulator
MTTPARYADGRARRALRTRATGHDRHEALAAGFDDHRAKPCLPNELLETIERLLKRRRSQPQTDQST